MSGCQFREYFTGKAFPWNTRETFCLEDFKCNLFALHSYYIYLHYPQKLWGGHSERKTLNRFSTTQLIHLLKRELLIFSKIIVASSPSLSHCHTLRGDLYPNITHTFSECRECFGDWETLEICQKKPVRLGKCNWVYCGIWRAKEDKASLS